MNISYLWLKELVDFDLTPAQLAEKLNAAGCAIEALENLPDGDTRLVAEITSNRGDCLGHYGVAREIAALTGGAVRLPVVNLTEKPIGDRARVTVEAPDLCPRYTARLIKGVTVKPSPEWLQRRLVAVGLRPINNVVDVTNYILYECNQPLHAFDFSAIAGQQIIVRRARDGEKFRALTGVELTLNRENLVIADAERAVAIAGIMGGENSEVTARAADILLESAFFAPAPTRRTSRQLKISSDSSYRYERGIDIAGCEEVSRRAAQLLVEVAGGEIYGAIDVYPAPVASKEITLRYATAAAVLGVAIAPAVIQKIFNGLDLKIIGENPAGLTVQIPPRRRDLEREIDLVEEVIRLAGFENVPDKFDMPLFAMPQEKIFTDEKIAREMLARLGGNEYVTDSFVPEKWEIEPENSPRVENPIDANRPVLRQSLMPSLLDRRRVNRGEHDLTLFELNTVYRENSRNENSRNENPRGEKTALAILDDRGPEYVFGAVVETARALKITAPLTVQLAADAPFFAPRSAAEIWLGDKKIGLLGMAADAQKILHDLDFAPALGEIDFAALSAAPRSDRVFKPLARFPGIRRDLALVVPEVVTWAQIAAAANEAETLEYTVESVYRGQGVESGKKSVAFSFTYFAPDRSLTNEEANAKRDALLRHLLAKIAGAALR
ncbi:phenylalanine--tRNA ligase beta subunit [Planctomycetales bacterium]|nr:phenylalanine--tRNA ligase beta subunit [Planctomycetales bacterium]GHT07466.1 phenylalanine--tRNA ligase beta subunit [Planctomycetales bacterium]